MVDTGHREWQAATLMYARTHEFVSILAFRDSSMYGRSREEYAFGNAAIVRNSTPAPCVYPLVGGDEPELRTLRRRNP